jgi:MYXO-CTERM domain-containing protein
VRALASADGPRAKQTPRSPTQAAAASDDVPSLWLAGAALFMAGLGGSYALQRRRS